METRNPMYHVTAVNQHGTLYHMTHYNGTMFSNAADLAIPLTKTSAEYWRKVLAKDTQYSYLTGWAIIEAA